MSNVTLCQDLKYSVLARYDIIWFNSLNRNRLNFENGRRTPSIGLVQKFMRMCYQAPSNTNRHSYSIHMQRSDNKHQYIINLMLKFHWNDFCNWILSCSYYISTSMTGLRGVWCIINITLQEITYGIIASQEFFRQIFNFYESLDIKTWLKYAFSPPWNSKSVVLTKNNVAINPCVTVLAM